MMRKSSQDVGASQEQRRCGRLKTEFLTSNLGRVLNLSGSGLLVLSRVSLEKQQGQEIEVTLKAFGQEAIVPCRVVRSEKLGFRKHKVGLEMVNEETARPAINALLHESVLVPGLGNQQAEKWKREAA